MRSTIAKLGISLLATLFEMPNLHAQAIQLKEVSLFDVTQDGKYAMCGIDFKYVFLDEINDSNKIGGVVGSLSWAHNNYHNVSALLKIVSRTESHENHVANAHIKAVANIFEPTRMVCDNEDRFCGVFYKDYEKIFKAVFTDGIDIRYNLKQVD